MSWATRANSVANPPNTGPSNASSGFPAPYPPGFPNQRNKNNNNNNHHLNGHGRNKNKNKNQNYSCPIRPFAPDPKVQLLTSAKGKHNDISYVVLDTGAFIGRQSFFNNFNAFTRYYMTPAVHAEVRDKASRQFLNSFPYEIIIKKPDPESIKFVQNFIKAHPTLRSLSKIDRSVVALSHTLELEFFGNANIGSNNNNNDNKPKKKHIEKWVKAGEKMKKTNKNKSNKNNDIKQETTSDSNNNKKNQKNKNKNGTPTKTKKTSKKDKRLAPIEDTGVRISKLKKVIPFNFVDFMTMNQSQYGQKYGRPMTMNFEIPADKKEDGNGNDNNSNNDVNDVNDDDQDSDLSDDHKEESKKNNKKLSKAQLRRERKRNLKNKNSSIKDHNDNNKKNDNNKNNLILSQANIADLNKKQSSSSMMLAQTELNIVDSDVESVKSELDKMIEHDLQNTFHETASILSSMSETNLKSLIDNNNNNNDNNSETKSQPPIRFGSFNPNSNNNNNNNNASKAQLQSKKGVDDAWNGEWLTPSNYDSKKDNNNNNNANSSRFPKAKKKKYVLKNVGGKPNKKNGNDVSISSVGCITMDLTMQKCLVDMGLRALSTNHDRLLNGKNGKKNEPIQFLFRCFGCFNFEHNTSRVTCRWCGNQTFQRVAIYEDEKGKNHYRYYYRDRFGYKYLKKHDLVPRGSQLVKNHSSNQSNGFRGKNKNNKNKRKKGRMKNYGNNFYGNW